MYITTNEINDIVQHSPPTGHPLIFGKKEGKLMNNLKMEPSELVIGTK